MVEVSVNGGTLHIEVLGWSRLLGFKRSLDIPPSAVKAVSVSSGLPHFSWRDIRAPGTSIPGVLAVGSYWLSSLPGWAFIDVTRWSQQVVKIEIEGQPYSLVIAEVKDAQSAMALIQSSGEAAPRQVAIS